METENYVYKKWFTLMEKFKEYLAIYTTEYEDTFLLESIIQDNFQDMKKAIQGMWEWPIENANNKEY